MELPFQIDLKNKVAVVTGGSGILGSVMCKALAKAGANVAVLGLTMEKINTVVDEITSFGGKAKGYSVDVMDKQGLEAVYAEIKETQGECSILINGAGGNNPKATTSTEYFNQQDLNDSSVQSFFDLDQGAVSDLFNLNFLGTLIPTQVFAQDMAKHGDSTIINISSMNAFTPLTKIPAYSGAKAAISNFTQWLAVHFSKAGIRVNAISPGFFLTDQNRELMIKEDGELSDRAHKILSQIPIERFGEPEELVGTLLWLVDHKASSYINGVVIPVDGGFLSYSGV